MLIVSKNLAELGKDEFWIKVSSLNKNDEKIQEEVYHTFYWLNSGI